MHRLLYVSTTTPSFQACDLDTILATARARNAEHDLTGVLLQLESDFLQVLEGPRASVESLFRSISRDPRHGAVTTLLSRSTASRVFPGEPMGFERLKETKRTEELFRFTRVALASSLPAAAGPQVLELVRSLINPEGLDLAA